MDNTKIAYSVPEAAAALGLSVNNTYSLVKTGRLPSIRLGKRILISRAELEKLLSHNPEVKAQHE